MEPQKPTTIRNHHVCLVPLAATDAPEMVHLLSSPELYRFTGGGPPTLEGLAQRYERQVAVPESHSESSLDSGLGLDSTSEQWFNWIIRTIDDDVAAGFVQATVRGNEASMAWLVGVDHQRMGYATVATELMDSWLYSLGVEHFRAHIHPQNIASQMVAQNLCLEDTGELDEEGEHIWRRSL